MMREWLQAWVRSASTLPVMSASLRKVSSIVLRTTLRSRVGFLVIVLLLYAEVVVRIEPERGGHGDFLHVTSTQIGGVLHPTALDDTPCGLHGFEDGVEPGARRQRTPIRT